jgi:hypothetical protein
MNEQTPYPKPETVEQPAGKGLDETPCSSLFCKCVNWCRDGRDMFSPHHPRCEHYTPPPADPRFARFGEAMWKYIAKLGGDFCGEEMSEDILPLAQAAGLCCRVEYDPETHGEGIEADPGDKIWWWGDFDWMNAKANTCP